MSECTLSGCRDSGLAAQFGNPTGWRGVLVGHLMFVKNAAMARQAVELLDVGEEDRILEIGFGPGRAIGEAARRARRGLVAGVDRSPVMLKQASRRNRRGIAAGRVELRLGEVARIPYPDGSFDGVFEVNSLHHWPDVDAGLREIRRVLVPGGRLLLTLRMEKPRGGRLSAPGYGEAAVRGVCQTVARNGFRDVRTEVRTAGRELTAVLATSCPTGRRRP